MARILVAEDEPDMAMGLRDNLQFEGYEVLEAADGEEAVRMVTEQRALHRRGVHVWSVDDDFGRQHAIRELFVRHVEGVAGVAVLRQTVDAVVAEVDVEDRYGKRNE